MNSQDDENVDAANSSICAVSSSTANLRVNGPIP